MHTRRLRILFLMIDCCCFLHKESAMKATEPTTAKKIEVEFANSIRDIWVFMCHPSKWPYHLDQQTIHYVVRYGMYRLGTKRAVIACGGVPTVLDR